MQVICWRKTFQIVSALGRLSERILGERIITHCCWQTLPVALGAVAGLHRLVSHLPHSPGAVLLKV